MTITGFASNDSRHPVSDGQVAIFTSKDPVGAPIFYRDVPLMPSETEKRRNQTVGSDGDSPDPVATSIHRSAAEPGRT